MLIYTYEHFSNDLVPLSEQCLLFKPDTVVAVARGGMTLAHALAMSLDVRNLQSIRAESYDGEHQRDRVSISGKCDLTQSKRVLVVDDIVDSGKTLAELLPYLQSQYPSCEFKVVTLFTKATAKYHPDFSLHEAHEWIEFFWERDFLKTGSL